jgi:hypothetical protein
MKKDKVVVFWNTGDKFNAEEIVFPYALNSKIREWWKEVVFIVWGSATKLLIADEGLQKKIGELKEAGVKLEACKACADGLGASDKLESLGIEVKYMGEPLTGYLKEGISVLSL